MSRFEVHTTETIKRLLVQREQQRKAALKTGSRVAVKAHEVILAEMRGVLAQREPAKPKATKAAKAPKAEPAPKARKSAAPAVVEEPAPAVEAKAGSEEAAPAVVEEIDPDVLL